jgi:hypothetical protein
MELGESEDVAHPDNPNHIPPKKRFLENLGYGSRTGYQLTQKSGQSYRRKFRSQTSDNMERSKAEQGRGIEKRKIRRKKSRRERVRRQKMQMREKVGKSRNTVFFQ